MVLPVAGTWWTSLTLSARFIVLEHFGADTFGHCAMLLLTIYQVLVTPVYGSPVYKAFKGP